MECGRCRNWFRLGYVGVPADVLTHLAKGPELYWNCSHCQRNSGEIVPNTVCDLIDAKLSEPIEKIKSICSDILAIKEFTRNQESVLKTEVVEIKDSVKSKHADLEQHINDKDKTTYSTVSQQIRFDGIAGVEGAREATTSENKQVNSICSRRSVQPTITNMKRLGKFNAQRKRPRTILVTFSNAWDARLLLAKAHLLKDLDEAVISKALSTQEIEIENKILKKRHELIESGIDHTELKIRSLKLHHKGEKVNIENTSN